MKMKRYYNLALALIAVACLATSASAQITFFEPTDDEPEPTENVIFDAVLVAGPANTVDTNMNASAGSNFGARGSFFVPSTPLEIGGATFQVNAAQTFAPGDEITVAIFSGTDISGADLTDISPTGLSASPGITILYEETFALPEDVPQGNFLIINFADSVMANAGDNLGIMFFSNVDVNQIEGSNNGGGRLLYRTAGTGGPSGARNLRYSILAPAPPVIEGDIPPAMVTTFRGVEVGDPQVSDFVDSDDGDASYLPGFTIGPFEAPVWLIFDANDADAAGVRVESSAGTPGLEYTVEAFNWAANGYDVLATQVELFNNDQVVDFAITPADHVDTNGDIRTRLGWRRVGFTINFPWQVNIDQVVWTR